MSATGDVIQKIKTAKRPLHIEFISTTFSDNILGDIRNILDDYQKLIYLNDFISELARNDDEESALTYQCEVQSALEFKRAILDKYVFIFLPIF